jgi:hypothetical protein
MAKYMDVSKFLSMVDNFSMVGEIRRLKEGELDEIFTLLDNNNTKIEKQVGFYMNSNYKNEIKTTGNFSPLEIGDIVIIKNDDKHYITIIEEVISNENTIK